MEKNSNPDAQTNSAFEAASSGQVNSAFEAASGSQVNSAFEPAPNQQGASAFESSSGVGSAFESDEDSAQSKARSRTFGLVDNKGYRHTLWGEEILRNQGAMSIVSTAWLQEESSEQKVLIKRIQGDADPNKVVLFSNEALITCENGSRGRHLAHGKFMGKDSQGRSFLVMEYYEGNNLEKKIEAGVYETNPGRCKAVIRGILEGLVELHDQGIVHRDLKPANIIVRSDNGVPVLLDFGLACKTNLRDLNVSTIGTFGYAAPEQQDGAAEHTIAFSADVYSVGVIFLEMLTPGFSVLKAGENFAGKIDRNDPERRQKLKARLKSFRKILDGQIAKLEKNNAGAFKNFISKCLEWAPEKRFQSGQEALDQFMSVAAQFHSELDPELDAANRIVKGSMTDPRDEKTYKTIKIGSKIWLAENLGYKTPNSLCYDNDEEIANKYGRLYTLSDAKKACPPGWRLPSKKDIEELIAAAGGARVAGKNLKSASGWQANDGQSGNGVDALGFSALPAGGWQTDSEKPDDPEENGFFLIGEKFDFWYDSGMLELYNHSNCADIEPFHIDYVDDFYSVRCIKDESVEPAIQQPEQDISVGNSSEENKVPKKSKAPVVIGFLVILFCIVAAVVYSNKSDEDLSADNQTQVENATIDSREETSSTDNQAQVENATIDSREEASSTDDQTQVENATIDSREETSSTDNQTQVENATIDSREEASSTDNQTQVENATIDSREETSSTDNQAQVENSAIDTREEASSADNQVQVESALKGSMMNPHNRHTYKTEKIGVKSTRGAKDEDKDGVPDYRDKCPNTLRGVMIDKSGCPVNKNDDIVKQVNAAPIMRDIQDFTIKEDENDGVIATIKTDQYARDKDHRFEELKWSWSGNKFLQVKYDKFKGTITVSQPHKNWNGKPERITFTVTDPEGAKASKTATFTVIPVNDPPVSR